MCDCVWKLSSTCKDCAAKREGFPFKPSFDLPKGYELREEEDVVHLYCPDGTHEVFTQNMTREALLAYVYTHLANSQKEASG